MNDEERKNFLAQVTGLGIDPFASPKDEPARFLSFLVRVENRGDEPLEFNPVNSWLTTNRKQILYPIGLDRPAVDVPRGWARAARGVREDRAGRARACPHDSSATRRSPVCWCIAIVDARTKSYQVDIELTRTNGKAVLFTAPFRRPPKGESEP